MVRRLREQSTTEDEIVIGTNYLCFDKYTWILKCGIIKLLTILDTSQEKKQKRHKHKKHKKRKPENDYDSDTSIDVSFEDGLDKSYKIKSKKELPGTSAADYLKSQTMKSSSDSRKSIPGSSSSTPPKAIAKKKKKGKDSGTSSEEERWLDAIKSGKLEEVSKLR